MAEAKWFPDLYYPVPIIHKDVVYNKEDPYRALAAWDKEINAEIARKREEFHLD